MIFAFGLAACGESAILVTVDGDLRVPSQLDGVCLHIADTDASGGAFGQFYLLRDDLAALPQSLAVEPGSASSARITARGYHAGVEVARTIVDTSFDDAVTVSLNRCQDAPRGPAAIVDSASADIGTRVAVSWGRGGSVLVSIGPSGAAAFVARDGRLEHLADAVPSTGGAKPLLVTFDADGDCDDDVLVAPVGEVPVVWLREPGVRFALAADGLTGMPPIVAAASFDADSDGDLDLVVGGGPMLALWRNDGAGRFVVDTAALGPGELVDVTAIAVGDIDGDGHADIAVGQGTTAPAPAAVFFNDAAGGGFFIRSTAALPEVPLMVRTLALADVTGDGRRDLLVSGDAEPVRVYVNRGDGRLEDRTFITLPDVDPVAGHTAAVRDWDGDCIADTVIALGVTQQPVSWRGSDTGPMTTEPLAPVVGDQVVLADLDDDGDADLIVAGAEEITWLSR